MPIKHFLKIVLCWVLKETENMPNFLLSHYKSTLLALLLLLPALPFYKWLVSHLMIHSA